MSARSPVHTAPAAGDRACSERREPRPAQLAVVVLGVARLQSITAALTSADANAVLATLTARLRATIADRGTLSRLGGDDFAVVSDELAERDDALSLGAQLVEAVTPLIVVEGLELFLTARAGVAYARPAVAASRLLRNAAAALSEVQSRPHEAVAICDLSPSCAA